MKHDYRFFYHYNTYSKMWGAMTADSVGYYSLLDARGNFAFGKTMSEARTKLYAKLENTVTA